MQLHYAYTKLNWDGHGTPIIVCTLVPNWFERIILRRTIKAMRYVKVGDKPRTGKKWCELDANRHVKPLHPFWHRSLINRLDEIAYGVKLDANVSRKKGTTIHHKGLK